MPQQHFLGQKASENVQKLRTPLQILQQRKVLQKMPFTLFPSQRSLHEEVPQWLQIYPKRLQKMHWRKVPDLQHVLEKLRKLQKRRTTIQSQMLQSVPQGNLRSEKQMRKMSQNLRWMHKPQELYLLYRKISVALEQMYWQLPQRILYEREEMCEMLEWNMQEMWPQKL
jgi:hypothetical protein